MQLRRRNGCFDRMTRDRAAIKEGLESSIEADARERMKERKEKTTDSSRFDTWFHKHVMHMKAKGNRNDVRPLIIDRSFCRSFLNFEL